MFDHIYTHIWMLVPYEERMVLVEHFDITKSGVTEIRNEEVLTDGYTNDDLAAITAERMAAFVGSEEPFMRLWELTVAKAHSIVNPPAIFPQPAPEELPTNNEPNAKKPKTTGKKK